MARLGHEDKRIGDPAYGTHKPYWQTKGSSDGRQPSIWQACPWYWWLCIIFVVATAIWMVVA